MYLQFERIANVCSILFTCYSIYSSVTIKVDVSCSVPVLDSSSVSIAPYFNRLLIVALANTANQPFPRPAAAIRWAAFLQRPNSASFYTGFRFNKRSRQLRHVALRVTAGPSGISPSSSPPFCKPKPSSSILKHHRLSSSTSE